MFSILQDNQHEQIYIEVINVSVREKLWIANNSRMLTLDIPDTVCYDVLSNFATKQNMLHIIYFLNNSHIYIDLSNN